MSYLVADRIAERKTKHHRHKENVYPHENRFYNKISVLLRFYQILFWVFSVETAKRSLSTLSYSRNFRN